MPLFSVIIPTYNRENVVRHAIDSIVNQAFADWEAIVIDDGGNDGTEELVTSYQDSRLLYHRIANRGPSGARNMGVEKSTGAFVTFLDSDDTVTPDWLRLFKSKISEQTGIVFAGMKINDKIKMPRRLGDLHMNVVGSLPQTAAIRKDVFVDAGGFDEKLRQSENWELMIRLIKRVKMLGLRIEVIWEPTYIYAKDERIKYSKERCLTRAQAYEYLAARYSNELPARTVRGFRLVSVKNYIKAGNRQRARQLLMEYLKAGDLTPAFLGWYVYSFVKPSTKLT